MEPKLWPDGCEPNIYAAAASLEYWARELSRPCYILKPRLSIDGDHWCALYGDNLQDGVAGFGFSPEVAYDDFDKNWRKSLKGAS
jgi:hypothetical protein